MSMGMGVGMCIGRGAEESEDSQAMVEADGKMSGQI